MLLDARRIETGTLLETDVCIIGAGAAGLTLANELSHAGIDILILESGGFNLDRDVQTLSLGETSDPLKHTPPSLYRQRRVGGSTAIWGGRCVPFDAIDFEARDGVHGWPIGFDAVERHYPAAAAYCEVGDPHFYSGTLARQRPLIAGFHDADIRCDSIERFSMPTHFGERWADALQHRPNVRLVFQATATKLAQSPASGAIEYLQCSTLTGRTFKIRAHRYVLCVGGLETVRVLAASDDLDPKGIGNRFDQLGRCYMTHVEGQLTTLRCTPAKRPIVHGFERSTDGIYCRRRITLSEDALRKHAIRNFVMRLHHPIPSDAAHRNGILSAMYLVKRWVIPEYGRKFSTLERAALSQSDASFHSHIGNVVCDAPRFLGFAADWTVRRYMMKRRIPHVVLNNPAGLYVLDYNAEQLPNPSSRVTLADRRDQLGVRRLRVEWRLSDEDVRSIVKAHQLIQTAFARTGVGQIDFPEDEAEGYVRESSVAIGGHHLGTARMASDPKRGVVDANCRVHDSPNLYVCGGAVFPTSGAANPTLTIVALALRLAQTLRAAASHRPGVIA